MTRLLPLHDSELYSILPLVRSGVHSTIQAPLIAILAAQLF
ncbi:hypothetical protein [Rubritalea tangerina]